MLNFLYLLLTIWLFLMLTGLVFSDWNLFLLGARLCWAFLDQSVSGCEWGGENAGAQDWLLGTVVNQKEYVSLAGWEFLYALGPGGPSYTRYWLGVWVSPVILGVSELLDVKLFLGVGTVVREPEHRPAPGRRSVSIILFSFLNLLLLLRLQVLDKVEVGRVHNLSIFLITVGNFLVSPLFSMILTIVFSNITNISMTFIMKYY